MMTMKKKPLALATLVAVAGAGGLTGSFAVNAAEKLTLEEVVVTARKKEESLQDVPVAVSSFSAGDLAAYNMTDTRDIAQFTPGLFTEPNSASNLSSVKTTIRGQVQADSLSTLDPSVGWYLDDLYIARTPGIAQSLLDLDRVEVLKGPQGTLYGRNTTGGAIKMITTKADPSDEISGYVTGTYGSFDAQKIGGAVNIPVIKDVFAVRLAALDDDIEDGYGDHTVVRSAIAGLYPGNKWIDQQTHKEDAGQKDTETYRASAVWNVNDCLSINALYQYTDFYANAILVNTLNAPAVGYTPPEDIFDDARSNNLQEAWNQTDNFILTIDYDISDTLRTKFVYGWRDMESSFMSDVDGTTLPLNYFLESFRQDSEQHSYEWQLAGELMDSKLEWLAGVYYFEEEGIDWSNSNGASSLPRGVFGGTYNATIDQNESTSGFLSGTYHLTERLGLTLGARYTEDTKPVEVYGVEFLRPDLSVTRCRFDVNTNPNSNPDTCTWGLSEDYDYWSWTGSIDYAFTDDVMVYLKSARGQRSGGQNLRALGIAQTVDGSGNVVTIDTSQPFEPEEATDVELGMKGQFFNNTLQLNVAYYHIWYKEVQVSKLLDTSKGLTTFVDNLSEADYDGLEADAQWVITDNFMLQATMSLFGFDFEDSNDYTSGMPDQEYTVRANYLVPASYGDWNFDVNYSYRGEYYPNSSAGRRALEDNNGFMVDDVSLWGARAALEMENGLTVAAWGRNLSDEEYTLSPLVLSVPAKLMATTPGEPRSYGVDVTYRF